MIARFLTEKYTVSSNEDVLKEKMEEFDDLRWYRKDRSDLVMTDGKPGSWFYGTYHEGEEDSGKFLCFSTITSTSGKVADSINFVFQYDDSSKKGANKFFRSSRDGNFFPQDNLEAAKRSSAFVRNLVKKMASLPNPEQIVKTIDRTGERMAGHDWER